MKSGINLKKNEKDFIHSIEYITALKKDECVEVCPAGCIISWLRVNANETRLKQWQAELFTL